MTGWDLGFGAWNGNLSFFVICFQVFILPRSCCKANRTNDSKIVSSVKSTFQEVIQNLMNFPVSRNETQIREVFQT